MWARLYQTEKYLQGKNEKTFGAFCAFQKT